MSDFAAHVIAWQRTHGRHGLPWQVRRDAYRVWVSEIMLQQTQVATVVPYYERFLRRFPDVRALADAALDDVLAHWSGLGYYSRARNLHSAARAVCERYEGRLPTTLEELSALPGIGRSTAAAIMVFAYGARCAILDGNVKRVLARVCAIEGYPGDSTTARDLWAAAEALLPQRGVKAYTQGMMDLGALVCVRRNPKCLVCPVADFCKARRERRVDALPAPRPRKALPHRKTVMLVLEHDGTLLVERRPPHGVWGGLWSFPELAAGEDAAVCAARLGAQPGEVTALPDVHHAFTHFTLTISPQRVRVTRLAPRSGEEGLQWFSIDAVTALGIPSPVRRIVELVRAARP